MSMRHSGRTGKQSAGPQRPRNAGPEGGRRPVADAPAPRETDDRPVLCIGSVLWDVIGRSASHMDRGSDVPGRITTIPGGVAMNIAMALRAQGVPCALLSAVGNDAEGRALLAAAEIRGLDTSHVYVSADLPTDRYMAVEGANGLIAAIADAHSLEAAGDRILEPLRDGRLGRADKPWTGMAALDGNLSAALLHAIVSSGILGQADLRVAPASPGKAERLAAFFGAQNATLYVNLIEAGILLQHRFATAPEAARALGERGIARAIVTDGGNAVAELDGGTVRSRVPPRVMVTRVTGAGDVFMAAHIAAERRGAAREDALEAALEAAAIYVSGDTPL